MKNIHILPKEESKMLSKFKEYFNSTTKEQIQKDWDEVCKQTEGIISPTISEFIDAQKQFGKQSVQEYEQHGLRKHPYELGHKQETLEEAAQRYSDDWENITGLDYEDEFPDAINKLDFINGAKWQAERMYSEEDLMDFGAFIRIEDRKEKRLFLIQDYFKVWFNQFKKK